MQPFLVQFMMLENQSYSALPPITATRPSCPEILSAIRTSQEHHQNPSHAISAGHCPLACSSKETALIPRDDTSVPLWNFSSIGGTNLRTLASSALEEVDTWWISMLAMGCRSAPRCVVLVIQGKQKEVETERLQDRSQIS